MMAFPMRWGEERDINVRDTSTGNLLHTPKPEAGSEPATQLCSLDWESKSNQRHFSAWANTNHLATPARSEILLLKRLLRLPIDFL